MSVADGRVPEAIVVSVGLERLEALDELQTVFVGRRASAGGDGQGRERSEEELERHNESNFFL